MRPNKTILEIREIKNPLRVDGVSVEILEPAKATVIDVTGRVTEAKYRDLLVIQEKVKDSQQAAALSEGRAKASEEASLASEQAAKLSEGEAKASEEASLASEQATKLSEGKAKASEDAAHLSEQAAALSEDKAKASEVASLASEQAAKLSEDKAKASEDASLASEQATKLSEDKAKASEDASLASEQAAKLSEGKAKASEEASLASEQAAKLSEDKAKASEGATLLSEQAAALSEDKAKASEVASLASEQAAKLSEDKAKASEDASLASEQATKLSEGKAKASEEASLASEQAAKLSEGKAKASEEASLASEQAAKLSEDKAKASEDASLASEQAAKLSEDKAKASEVASLASEQATKLSEGKAKASEDAALLSEQAAALSEGKAKASEDAAHLSEQAAALSEGKAEGFVTIVEGLKSAAAASEAAAAGSEAQALLYRDEAAASKNAAAESEAKAESYAQIISSALIWRGEWDASAGDYPTPTLNPETADYYRISVAGVMDGPQGPTDVEVGDYLHWNLDGDYWFKIDATDQVTSVNGQMGAVVLDKSDVGLGSVPNYPITSSVSDGSASKFASAAAVKAANDNANSRLSATAKAVNSALLEGKSGAHYLAWANFTGVPATASRWPSYAEVTGKPASYPPSSHTHAWSEVTGVPSTASRWPSWSEVTSKPSSFAPSAHTHTKAEAGLSNVPNYTITDSATDGSSSKFASAAAVKSANDNANTRLPASSYTASDVLAKVKSVDGSGSGLDADLLDGLNATNFARLGTTSQPTNYLHLNRNSTNSVIYANQTGSGDIARFFKGTGVSSTSGTAQVTIKNNADIETTGGLTVGDGSGQSVIKLNNMALDTNLASRIEFRLGDGQHIQLRHNSHDSVKAPFGLHLERTADNYQSTNKTYLDVEGEIYANGGNKVFHAGNDGSGSGLDADTLDGKHLSAIELDYQSADASITAAVATKLPMAGGTMTGKLSVNNPNYDQHIEVVRGNLKATLAPSTSGSGEFHIKTVNMPVTVFDNAVRATSFTGSGSGLTGTASLRATGTTKADVGLSNVPNYTITSSVSDSSDTKFATAGAVKKAYDAAMNVEGVPSGGIIMWSGSHTAVPSGWALCDGSNGTPNLRDRFVVGAGGRWSSGNTGGSANAVVVSHSHSGTVNSGGDHNHTGTTGGGGSHRHIQGAPVMSSSLVFGFYTGTRTGYSTTSGSHYMYPYTSTDGNHTHSFTTSTVGGHTHTMSVDSTGESGTDKNLPPFYALAYIMKL